MTNFIFEKKTIVGLSKKSVSDAIETAIKEYHSKKPISWFEVVEIRGKVTSNNEIEYQVTINIGQKTN